MKFRGYVEVAVSVEASTQDEAEKVVTRAAERMSATGLTVRYVVGLDVSVDERPEQERR